MTEEIAVIGAEENSPERITDPTPRPDLRSRVMDYVTLLLVSGVIVLADQWTKNLVAANLEFGERWAPWEWLSPYFRIVHWRNTGAAFGMFQNGGMVIGVFAVIVTLVIIYYYPQVPKEDWALRVAMAMQLAGALGNLTDRILRGYVIDFISFGNFPVFNIADSSITVGATVLLIGVWIAERQEKKALAEALLEDQEDVIGE